MARCRVSEETRDYLDALGAEETKRAAVYVEAVQTLAKGESDYSDDFYGELLDVNPDVKDWLRLLIREHCKPDGGASIAAARNLAKSVLLAAESADTELDGTITDIIEAGKPEC